MTLTLFDLTYRTARELGVIVEGVATAGGATSLIDTVERNEAEHYWKGGTVWILYNADSIGNSPQGKYAVITAFASDSDTLTFPTLTDAVGAGDRYALAISRFPLYSLISAVNRALNEIMIPVVDTTTVDTAVDKSEYSIVLAANLDLRRVYMQGRLNDANDNQWQELLNWEIQPVAAGTADLLVFPYQLPSGYDIKLVYAAPHTNLNIYSDKLADMVDWRRVVYRAAYYLMLNEQMQTGKEDRVTLDAIERFQRRAEEADIYYRVPIPSKPSHLMIPEA